MHSRDMDGWNITFVNTGLHANIGQRLMRVKQYVENEDAFLANYADGLSDLPLDRRFAYFHSRDVTAMFAAVRSSKSFHAVHAAQDGTVTHMGSMPDEELWING